MFDISSGDASPSATVSARGNRHAGIGNKNKLASIIVINPGGTEGVVRSLRTLYMLGYGKLWVVSDALNTRHTRVLTGFIRMDNTSSHLFRGECVRSLL